MNYQDPYQPHHEHFWHEDEVTPRWAKIVSGLILIVGVIAAIAIYVSRESNDPEPIGKAAPSSRQAAPKQEPVQPKHQESAEPHSMPPPATSGTPNGVSGGFLGPEAEASFGSFASSLPAQVGLAVQPLGGGEPREFGDLREGHAWSSIKVPILTTLLREQGEALDSEEKAWATSAITASDNSAVADLFGRLEKKHGGLVGASQAVEAVLRAAGDTTTVVATAPPPPGAVSTYGQTEWSLLGSVAFYGSLARCQLLGPTGTSYVEGLMESVIPEQRWGLGEAGFPSGWSVAMKGGWGPEASAGGSYLVRQSGIVRDGNRGIAVAMIAMDQSGSYPAGASDLTQVAQWLAGELHGLGPPAPGCTG